MITKKQITEFWQNGPFALAGVSRNRKKFGHQAWTELRKRGYALIPVNPNTEEIDGEKCYKNVSGLPDEIRSLIIMTKKDQSAALVKEAASKGIKHIWIQQMSDTPEAISAAEEAGINLIHGKCVLMFSEPVGGIHRFHRSIMKFFGRLPR